MNFPLWGFLLCIYILSLILFAKGVVLSRIILTAKLVNVHLAHKVVVALLDIELSVSLVIWYDLSLVTDLNAL